VCDWGFLGSRTRTTGETLGERELKNIGESHKPVTLVTFFVINSFFLTYCCYLVFFFFVLNVYCFTLLLRVSSGRFCCVGEAPFS